MQSITPSVPIQPFPGTFVVPTTGPLVNPYQNNTLTTYKQKPAHILGVIQMVIGVLCGIFSIVSLAVGLGKFNAAYICGYGIWCGALFFVAGILGMFSGKGKQRKDLIIATMVMSIIAAVFTSVSLSLGIIDACTKTYYYDYYYGYPYVYKQTTANPTEKVVVSMGALIAILSFIEASVAIASSVLCCQAVCCCSSTVPMTYMQVYNPETQQIMFFPQAGYVPQYAPPTSNAIFSNANPTAPPQNFHQQQVQDGASGFQPYGTSGMPPAYSQGLGEKDDKKY